MTKWQKPYGYLTGGDIAQIRATKVYSENPRVEVTISTIGG